MKHVTTAILPSGLKSIFVGDGPVRQHKDILKIDIQGLRKQARAINCVLCGRSEHVCTGRLSDQDKDFALLAEAARCMASVDSIFRFCLQTVAEIYRTYAVFRGNSTVRVAYFTVSGGNTGLDGHTDFPPGYDTPAQRAALITLRLPVSGLNAAHYFAFMYAICHEIGIHSVQAISAEDKRPRFGQSCPLTEGFIDHALSDELIARLGNKKTLPSHIASIASRAASHIAVARHDRENGIGQIVAKTEGDPIDARHLGAESYRWLREFSDHCEMQTRFWRSKRNRPWLMKLALNSNLYILDRSHRRNLAALCHEVFNPDLPTPNERQKDLVRALDEFAKTATVGPIFRHYLVSGPDIDCRYHEAIQTPLGLVSDP